MAEDSALRAGAIGYQLFSFHGFLQLLAEDDDDRRMAGR